MTSDNLLTGEEFEELIFMAKSKNAHTFCSIQNSTLGEIVLPHGRIDFEKDKGFGYEHIVYGRTIKDKLNVDQITGLLIKTLELLKNTKDCELYNAFGKNRKYVLKDDIKVILSKETLLDKDVWVITSYPLFENKTKTIKKETLDFLSTVNATEEYAQYYSYFRDIVGALVSSINITKNKQNVNGGQEI